MENEKIFELMEKMYADLKGGQDDLKKEVSKVKQRLTNVENRITNIDTRAGSIEKIVVKIEDEHGKKLEALFDGYVQNTEQLTKIEKEVKADEEVIIRRVK